MIGKIQGSQRQRMRGSDASAACGRFSELSEWQRSVCNAAAPSARRTPGTANRAAPIHRRFSLVRRKSSPASATRKKPHPNGWGFLFGCGNRFRIRPPGSRRGTRRPPPVAASREPSEWQRSTAAKERRRRRQMSGTATGRRFESCLRNHKNTRHSLRIPGFF